MNLIKKGDRVAIRDNSIFECMGFKMVTGTVFLVYPDGHGFALKCDQTKAIENCDFNDGSITLQA